MRSFAVEAIHWPQRSNLQPVFADLAQVAKSKVAKRADQLVRDRRVDSIPRFSTFTNTRVNSAVKINFSYNPPAYETDRRFQPGDGYKSAGPAKSSQSLLSNNLTGQPSFSFGATCMASTLPVVSYECVGPTRLPKFSELRKSNIFCGLLIPKGLHSQQSARKIGK